MGSRTRVDHQEDQEVAIAIEDEVEDGVGEVQEPRGGRVTRQGSRVQEKERLCEFPPGESPCVTVTYKDYKTLEHDTWLNDIIIDFFLAWLHRIRDLMWFSDFENLLSIGRIFYQLGESYLNLFLLHKVENL